MEQTLYNALKHVKDNGEALALATDPRNLCVVCEGSIVTYMDPDDGTERPFNGILAVLAYVFWPDDARKTRAKLRNKAKEAARQRAAARKRSLSTSGYSNPTNMAEKGKRHNNSMMAGLAYGSRVHRQLEDSIYLDVASFERKYGSMTPAAKAILNHIHASGVTLVRPEFAVYDAELDLCARFDAWGVLPDGTLVFYEYKTGSKNCFRAEGPTMVGPLRGIMGDSDMNRALIQLAFSILILIKHHPYVTRYEAYVLRPAGGEDGAGKNRIKSYPLSHKFLKTHGPAIYAAVRAARLPSSK